MNTTIQPTDCNFELIPDGYEDSNTQRVIITGIKLKWTNVVGLMVKVAFCSIPAIAIIMLVYAFFAALLIGGTMNAMP